MHGFKKTFGVASGRKKAPAVLGALNTNLISVLVIDDAIAEEVLSLAGISS